MSETDAAPLIDPVADGVPYGTRLTELASASPDKIAVITVASDGGERVLTLGQLESRANQWGWQLTASGAAEGRPGSSMPRPFGTSSVTSIDISAFLAAFRR